MANLVLYRKYRPKSFDDVVGQEQTVAILRNAVLTGFLSHAYLFSGPRGSGKTTMARLLAKAVNCKNPSKGDPCNACGACEELGRGNSLDLIEIDAASNRGIDEIRDLKENVRFAPATLKYKVYVIDEAHQLTKEAANALLKTLEEPPAHALFILATTEAHKMIPTILSRCQRFDFKKLRSAELVERMSRLAKAEGARISKDALKLIASNAGGSFRDAEGILDKVFTFYSSSDKEITTENVKELLGIVEIGLIGDFVDLISRKNAPEAIAFISHNLQEGVDPQEFMKNLVQYLRQMIIIKVNPELTDALDMGLTGEEEARITKQATDVEAKELQRVLEEFAAAEQKMKYASIIQLPLELATLTACGI